MQTRKPRLIPTLPPSMAADPRILSWRLDQHQEAIEHLNETKMDRPHFNPSLTKAAGVLGIYALGLLGLLSPERTDWLIKLLSWR